MKNSREFIYRTFKKPQPVEQSLLEYKVSEYLPEIIKDEWDHTRFVTLCMAEELVFRVEEDDLDEYLIADYEIWAKAVGSCDGFMGKETWFSSKAGLVTSIIFWEGKEQRESINQA